ncbi:MAG TPA: M67 family metallopeptidase [Candidatus Saccharimonadales bacterium]|jgi:proteasome lid subunit RPN8/RPN11|nr:M67 family metallopeptidase [Candidatus Saccharimonadales bacterium]
MATAPTLKMSTEIAQKIRQHGADSYPNECCGALLGRDAAAPEVTATAAGVQPPREILALFPLVNRRDDSPRNRFSVTAEDVRDAEKAAQEKKLDVVGWYHSHPDHPAQPSQYDREHAWPWYSYVIVSVTSGKPAEMTSWRLSDDRSAYACEDIAICDHATP